MARNRWTAACGAAILAAAGAAAAWADDDGMGAPLAATAPVPVPAPARVSTEDVLVLKDGTEIHGRITAEDDAGYAVKAGGSLRVVEKSRVAEVRRGAPAETKPEEVTADSVPDKKDGKARRKEMRRGEDAPPATPLTDDGKAWARSCIERLASADPAVQRSAAEALRALGAPVLPALKEAMAAADDAGKQRLERVAGMIGKGADQAPPAKPGKPGGAARGPERGMGMLEKVRTDLGLDDAQSRTVGGALIALGRETREVLEDARDGLITYEDARTKVAGLRGKLREDLKATLSEEQLGRLDGILDEMGRRMGGPKKDAPAAPK